MRSGPPRATIRLASKIERVQFDQCVMCQIVPAANQVGNSARRRARQSIQIACRGVLPPFGE